MSRSKRRGRVGSETAASAATALVREPVVAEAAVANRFNLAGPGPCVRRFQFPARFECPEHCPGRQEDGTCLSALLHAAKDQEVDWQFEVVPDPDVAAIWGGVWVYVGQPVDLDASPLIRPEEVPEPPSFDCPHCGAHNVQDLANLHYWCGACGKNATDPER